MKPRTAQQARSTKETSVKIKLNLEGKGTYKGKFGVGFLEHMLELFCFFSGFDLEIKAQGDLHVDAHHTVEDLGITLGKSFLKALGTKKGITRFGSAVVPMDEALTQTVVDISGRPYLIYRVTLRKAKFNNFDTELVEEFFRAFANNAMLTLHINSLYGRNTHHILEAIFKSAALALKQAVSRTRTPRLPSTKGKL